MSDLIGDRDVGPIRLRVRKLRDFVGQSFFVLPTTFTLGAVVLAQAMVELDRRSPSNALATRLETDVDSTRTMLSAVAGGTITGASVVFSLTLIAVQVAGSQFSPRALTGLFEDRFQKMVMGVVIGTFVYSLVVLRAIRPPIGDSEAFVPVLSSTLGLVLAVAALLALIASIDHVAGGLRVGAIADGITDRTVAAIERNYAPLDSDDRTALIINRPVDQRERRDDEPFEPGPGDRAVESNERGWVTDISPNELVSRLPEATTLHVIVPVGSFVDVGQPLAYIASTDATTDTGPDADRSLDEIEVDTLAAVRDGFAIGATRTLTQDVAFGVTQLSDIAVRALSPGINDPNTAIELIARLRALLIRLHLVDLGPDEIEVDGRIVRSHAHASSSSFTGAALDEIRFAGRENPRVMLALLDEIGTIANAVRRARPSVSLESLERQVDRIVADLDHITSEVDRRHVAQRAHDVERLVRRQLVRSG